MASYNTETSETEVTTNTVVLYHFIREIRTNNVDPATGTTRTTTEQVVLTRTDSITTTNRTVTITATFSVPANVQVTMNDDDVEELVNMMRNLSLH